MKETEFITLQASIGEKAIQMQNKHSFYNKIEKTIQGAISVAYTILVKGEGTAKALIIKSKTPDIMQWNEMARIYRDTEHKNENGRVYVHAVPLSEEEAKHRIRSALDQTHHWKDEYSTSFCLISEDEEQNKTQDDNKSILKRLAELEEWKTRVEEMIFYRLEQSKQEYEEH